MKSSPLGSGCQCFVKSLILMALATQFCGAAQVTPKPPVLIGSAEAENGSIDLTHYGAVGDGVEDDTVAVQKALARCSNEGLTCRVPEKGVFLLKAPIFMWGDGSLVGAGGVLEFSVQEAPYLLNIGISGKRKVEQPFTGSISGVNFQVSGGKGGRIIFLWRTRGAKIVGNTFNVGAYPYSATSSGNNHAWVENGFANCVREGIYIARNKVFATSEELGSEGIGLEHFSNAIIEGNEVVGVGDDPVGIHFSKNIIIRNNSLKSVDGRLFVSNSEVVEIIGNRVERTASVATGKSYTGIGLIYVGFESYQRSTSIAPTDIVVRDNVMRYAPGSKDRGAALYFRGPRQLVARGNRVINDSTASELNAAYLVPVKFSEGWVDPVGKDPADTARVWDVLIEGNISEGLRPLPFRMTGNCGDYPGPVRIERNRGPAFNYYCDSVTVSGNVLVNGS